MSWEPIETAPKDGSIIVCWASGWKPCLLTWKTNERISKARQRGENVGNMVDSYFGDPCEWDDYDLAKPGEGPTHWHPLAPFPYEPATN